VLGEVECDRAEAEAAEDEPALKHPHLHLLTCQYLYFSTSKASKLSTSPCIVWISTHTHTNTHTNTHTHTHTHLPVYRGDFREAGEQADALDGVSLELQRLLRQCLYLCTSKAFQGGR